eukprot:GILI01026481.1.p1 GENE.GILI01026481.1~~GILI01026481.1.p1  ORF type:complete len:174 (+),score=33.95 GILI01026481.1:51-524(+)
MTFDSFYFGDDIVQDSTNLFSKSPRSLYEEYKQATSSAALGGDGKPTKLPTVAADSKMYLSSALMLKKTRAEVEEYGKDLGAVSTIADLPVSSDVRVAVAKIFADPKNADAISEAEWRRRELEYRMNRELFNEKINEHLRRERDVLHRELSQLPKPK